MSYQNTDRQQDTSFPPTTNATASSHHADAGPSFMPSKAPPVMACTLCRRSKAKCVRSNPTADRCDRCLAVGCACIVEKHKRGRKRMRGLDLPRADDATRPAAPFGFRQFSPESVMYPPRSASEAFRSPETTITVNLQPESDNESDTAVASPVDQSQYAANPLPFISGSDRPFSIHNLLHPTTPGRTSTDRRNNPIRSSTSESDLIAKGVITLEVGQRLFSFFMNTLNPIIMLFDPHLHTFELIRGKSRFLLTTIIAAAARFIAPTLASIINQEVRECSVQAVLGGRRNIETVQSWMVMFFYKAPRDDRGWTYVGLLCRQAVEIGLDRTPLDDAPGSTETEQRERRNRIRTWMLAFMMDRAVSSTTGRDWCLRGHDAIIQDTRRFSNHRLRSHGDGVIAGFAELRRIAGHAIDNLSNRDGKAHPGPSSEITRYLMAVNFDLDEWKAFWQNELLRQQSPQRYWAYLHFFELHIRLTLNSYAVNARQLLRPVPDNVVSDASIAAEQYCYNIAIENLVQLQTIRALNVSFLQHAQDSISIMVAYAACFLRVLVNSPSITVAQREQASDLIHFTSDMFKTVSRNQETTAALQAEFLHNLFAHDNDRPDPGPQGIRDASWPSGNSDLNSNTSFYDLDGTAGQAPHIDVSDFDTWLTAFEQDALPNPFSNVGSSTQMPGSDMIPPPFPDTNSNDWDAIFLSWLNPDQGS